MMTASRNVRRASGDRSVEPVANSTSPTTKAFRPSGAETTGVGAGSAATGDVVTAVDDRWAANVHDVYEAAAAVEPGRPAPVAVRRGDQELTLTVRPADGA